MLLDLVQKTNGSHVSAVKTKSKPFANGEDPDQPVLAGREVERENGLRTRRFRQNAHKAHNVGAGRLSGKRLCRGKSKDVIPRANQNLSFEGKTAFEFQAKLCLADWLPDHKGACCPKIHYTEAGHLTCQDAGTKGPVPAYVDTP